MLINLQTSAKCIKKIIKSIYKTTSKTYKKSNRNRFNNINLDAKKAQMFEIDYSVEKMWETEVFLTILDHEGGFPLTLCFHLINPSKLESVKISKSLLGTINENIPKETNLNQWKNISQVRI